jgi:hypothetical protein
LIRIERDYWIALVTDALVKESDRSQKKLDGWRKIEVIMRSKVMETRYSAI